MVKTMLAHGPASCPAPTPLRRWEQSTAYVESLFQGEILNALNAHATFDLTEEIDKASNEIAQAIAKADVPGLKIQAGTPSLALEGVYVTAENLVVVVKLTTTIDAEVTETILK